MERELMDLFEAAKKAADVAATDGVPATGPEMERCVDALKQLRGLPVNYDILVATQVGKKLRPLTKHPRERIQIVASDLLELWKKIVIEETTRKKKNGTSHDVKIEKAQKVTPVKIEKVSNSEPVEVKKIAKCDSAKDVSVEKKESNGDVAMSEKLNRGETVKVEKMKEEKQAFDMKKSSEAHNALPKLTSMVKCNDPLRDKLREILVEALSKVAGEADEEIRDQVTACDPIRVAVAVESVMFERMGRSNGTQKVKYRSIMFNLKDQNNPDLRRKVLLGEVKPEELITMTSEEMASEQRKREIEQIQAKALFECQRGIAPKATTNQFRCGRCGKRECTYSQMQTRSADEPMTTYVTCVNCNKRWKFC